MRIVREISIPNPTVTNRVGWIVATMCTYPEIHTAARDNRVRIMQTIPVPETGQLIHITESELFDPLQTDEPIPQYEVTITLRQGGIEFHYERRI